jgi:predicted transcriptional regulator of viral defense system
MTTLEVLERIQSLKMPFIQTRDLAGVLKISVSSTGKYLDALSKKSFLIKLTRGKWILNDKNIDPLAIAEFITSPLESYISLQTALFYHGMIEQVPSRIYAVTIARTKLLTTRLGTFSLHHCNPDFFLGYEYLKPMLKVATPEKALVDFFYFAPTKSRQFTKLPELDLPAGFSWKKVDLFCKKIPSPRTQSLVRQKLSSFR